MTMIIKRFINNIRDGHHLNSKYWQDWKKSLPMLSSQLREIAIAIVLSDATMYKVSREAYIKFEQGYLQKEFVEHLFYLFKEYCFMLTPGVRVPKSGHRTGLVKSYWFKTFTHVSFTEIWDLFYFNKSKAIQPGLIMNNINGLGLAYWIIGDGSLSKDGSMILHTQSFTRSENEMLSKELNEKFSLNSKVISHKEVYYVIHIPRNDASKLRELIAPHMLPFFKYKIPGQPPFGINYITMLVELKT